MNTNDTDNNQPTTNEENQSKDQDITDKANHTVINHGGNSGIMEDLNLPELSSKGKEKQTEEVNTNSP